MRTASEQLERWKGTCQENSNWTGRILEQSLRIEQHLRRPDGRKISRERERETERERDRDTERDREGEREIQRDRERDRERERDRKTDRGL